MKKVVQLAFETCHSQFETLAQWQLMRTVHKRGGQPSTGTFFVVRRHGFESLGFFPNYLLFRDPTNPKSLSFAEYGTKNHSNQAQSKIYLIFYYLN